MSSDSMSSAPRRTVLVRMFFAALALAFVLFAPTHAYAVGTVSLTTKEPEEVNGKWKLNFTINYGSKPHIAYIPMIFSFTPVALYERSLTDQSPEKPVITRIALQNQPGINESMDVGFSNSAGEVFTTTKFDFVIRRDKGFEAGEYDLKITRADDGAQMGQTIKLKLKGENPIVDRRAIVFAGEKKKKPAEEKKEEASTEKKEGEEGSSESSGSSEASSAAAETPAEAPPAVAPKQGGCGCRMVDVQDGSAPALATMLVGALIALRRRVHG